MWLSNTARQAIQAVLCIAGQADDGPVRVDEIAAVMKAPRNYLSKTLHQLTRAGILRSERGPRGGFRVATPPSRLTLARVIAPFEPVGEPRCLLGRPSCGDANACAAHQHWKVLTTQMEEFFRTTTIASLLRGNPRVTEATRAAIDSLRLQNQRTSHGSVA